MSPATLETLRDDSWARTSAFSGYDGTIILSRPLPLPWLGFAVPTQAMQIVPEWLRKFPGDYDEFEKRGWENYRESRFGH